MDTLESYGGTVADKHPYVSGTGVLVQVLGHLKKSFPTTFDADVLRKLGFAPQNESYIINTIRFIKLIDENGARTPAAQKTFTLHDSTAFARAFSDLVKSAYVDLFRLHGDNAWNLDSARLITYFRQTDQSSELVGTRQANTFKALSTYAGKVEAPMPSARTKTKSPSSAKSKAKPPAKPVVKDNRDSNVVPRGIQDNGDRNFGLTVRIEINLPASGDQDTYDRIFKSIRANLINV